MNQKTRLIFNTIVNTGSHFLSLLLRFLLIPFIIGIVGREPYGIWIILGTFFAYANMLQMGLNSSITRLVPFLQAQQKMDELNQRINTVIIYFILLSLLIGVITVIAYIYFQDWFSLDPKLYRTAQMMVLVVGLSQMISLPLEAYGAIIAGMQRYEITVGITLVGEIIRTALIFSFLPFFSILDGVVYIAFVSGCLAIISAGLKTFSAYKLCPGLQFSIIKHSLSYLWEQLIYGINSSIYVLSELILSRIAIIIIGIYATTKESTDYGIAIMLVLAGMSLIAAINRGIKPAASRYHGKQEFDSLRTLLMRSTSYNTTIISAMILCIVIFGSAFFNLWIGSKYSGIEGEEILSKIIQTSSILVIGYSTKWILEPAYKIVNGMGKHFIPALISILTALVSAIFLSILLFLNLSIDKISWGITIPMLISWGIFMPLYCLKTIQISLFKYFIKGVLKPFLVSSPAFLISYLLTFLYVPDTWIKLVIEIIFALIVLLLFFLSFNLEETDKTQLIEKFKKHTKNFKVHHIK